jgi:hypothetical protein
VSGIHFGGVQEQNGSKRKLNRAHGNNLGLLGQVTRTGWVGRVRRRRRRVGPEKHLHLVRLHRGPVLDLFARHNAAHRLGTLWAAAARLADDGPMPVLVLVASQVFALVDGLLILGLGHGLLFARVVVRWHLLLAVVGAGHARSKSTRWTSGAWGSRFSHCKTCSSGVLTTISGSSSNFKLCYGRACWSISSCRQKLCAQ